MEMVDAVMQLLGKGATFGGTVWMVWHAIELFSSMKEANGPGIKTGLMGVAGGIGMIAMAALLANIAW